jgi:toxin ParE1/3/4
LIAANPSIGELQSHLGEDVRARVVGRYVIFHRVANDRVEILRVIPGDREITWL